MPALDRAIFIEDDQAHVFDVVIERVTECDHLDQRRKEHEKKRERIAQDGDEFLEENCAEPAKRATFHEAVRRWLMNEATGRWIVDEAFARSQSKTPLAPLSS